MEIYRAYKTELNPNNTQKTAFIKCSDISRFTWNWALNNRINYYKETGKYLNAIDQHKQLIVLKKTKFFWLYDISKYVPQESLRNLDKAYQNFFQRVKSGKKPGFPKYKSKKAGINSFKFSGNICISNSSIRLPRIGWVRLKEHNYIPTSNVHILSATISNDAGKWYVSVQVRQDVEINQAVGESIGVDLGIKELAVISDGRRFENPKALKKYQIKLKRLQRELSRRKKGSKNREKTRKKLAKLYKKISNTRKDTLHKTTSTIVAKNKLDSKRPNVVVIEDLNVVGMMKNHHLAQAIGDASFYEFRRQLEYKCKWYGSELLVADRFFPSSKLCSFCGSKNKELKLSDRKWTCKCGKVLDRDLNAAINLKNLAVRWVPSKLGESISSNACGENIRPTNV